MMAASATYHASSPPEAIWAVYTDVGLWPRWSDDILWAEISGPYVTGAHGRMRFKGLPATDWEVIDADPPGRFRSVVRLPLGLARLEFDHVIAPGPDGSRITESVDFRGPLAPVVGLLQRGRWLRRWPTAMGQMCVLAYERGHARAPRPST